MKTMSELNDILSNGIYVCPECGTEHKFSELVTEMANFDYTYYCKNCNEVIESNGKIYGKFIEK